MEQWVVVANTAGAIVVVVLFLQHLKQDREARIVTENARHEALKHIGDECHAHSGRMLSVMEKALEHSQTTIAQNTATLGRVTEVLARFDQNVDRLAAACEEGKLGATDRREAKR